MKILFLLVCCKIAVFSVILHQDRPASYIEDDYH